MSFKEGYAPQDHICRGRCRVRLPPIMISSSSPSLAAKLPDVAYTGR